MCLHQVKFFRVNSLKAKSVMEICDMRMVSSIKESSKMAKGMGLEHTPIKMVTLSTKANGSMMNLFPAPDILHVIFNNLMD